MLTQNKLVTISEQEKLRAITKIQSVALKAIHDFMEAEEIDQVMPVILSKFTDPLGPDPGSTVIKTGEIEYQGQKLQLTQSMILHKQIAIGMGLHRFYIVSPNVRLESAKQRDSGRHAFEFSQVDFEFKDAKMADIFKLVEGIIRHVRTAVELKASDELENLGREMTPWGEVFPVYTTHELFDKYGEDWESKASYAASTPFFAVCHKREFYDKLDRSREGEHFLNYDLIYPEGYGEGLSGAERESEYEDILERLIVDKLEKQYEGFIEMAKEGKTSPSAGGGIGVERLVRFLTGMPHIRDVQLFKRIPGDPVVM
ncbi:MAG: asparagine synthetase [Candidatus Heimdallarchaeota archaeon]|nr:asparagine synthetase [Candidatus Heimdallarchaeota archaeon]